MLIIILGIFLAEPSETPVLLGLSTQRLLMLGGMLTISVGLLWFGWRVRSGGIQIQFLFEKKQSWKNNSLLIAATLLFSTAWAMLWTPPERFGNFQEYILRFYPFIIWLVCMSGVAVLILLAVRYGVWIDQFQSHLRQQRGFWMVAGATLIVIGLLAWAASVRVVGMTTEEDFWYGAGVPVLTIQVLIAALVSLFFSMLWKKFRGSQRGNISIRADWVIFIIIWIITAWLWVGQSARPDFNISRPVPPNQEQYPDYDSKFYDITGQYALIGQGLNNGVFYDRMLYPAFLVYLHILGGQDYGTLMAIQTGILAVFPALSYLLGKRLHSRPIGMGLAVLLSMRGLNSIALGGIIDTSHQKHMMTDFPTGTLILLACLLIVKWVQSQGRGWVHAGLAGGVIGLTTLLRPHALGLVGVLALLIFIVYRQRARLWVSMGVLVMATIAASILPWSQFGGHDASLDELYFKRIKEVIRKRYPEFPLPGEGSSLPVTRAVTSPIKARLAQQEPKSMPDFVIDNFLNNLVTSTQTLPATPYWWELRKLVRESENYWKPYWDGGLSQWASLFLPLDLALVALGIAVAWKRARLSGMIPLLAMLAFFVMNALARTSGGRYLVPVDWVLILYYFFGLMWLWEMVIAFFGQKLFSPETLQGMQDIQPLSRRRTALQVLGMVLLFVALGSLIPLSGSLFEQRYPPTAKKKLGMQFVSQVGQEAGISQADIKAFIAHPGARIIQGRILYPRLFDRDVGNPISMFDYYHPRLYPHMVMVVLGPRGETWVWLPVSTTPKLPNASDAIVLGCREGGYVQAWAILLTSENRLFKRDPAASFNCPLPEPVCDNNRNCQ